MKTRIRLLLFFGLAAAASPAWSAGFSRELEDLPLMTGLTELLDDSVVFSSTGGRLADVKTQAGPSVSQQAVSAFYFQTLPQLGWNGEGDNAFRRGAERLTIEFQPGPPLMVWFRIRPVAR